MKWKKKPKNDEVPLQEEFRSVLWCKKRVHRLNNKLTFISSDNSALNKIYNEATEVSIFFLICFDSMESKFDKRATRRGDNQENEWKRSITFFASACFCSGVFFLYLFFYENEILVGWPTTPPHPTPEHGFRTDIEQIETDKSSWTHSAASQSNQLWVVDPNSK